jgi:hypothetical protein
MIRQAIISCESKNNIPIINESNVEKFRSIAFCLQIDKLIDRCDSYLLDKFPININLEFTNNNENENDAAFTRLLTIQSSEPTRILGEKIAQFIINKYLAVPSFDNDLLQKLSAYKNYISRLKLKIVNKLNENQIQLLKHTLAGNTSINSLELKSSIFDESNAQQICEAICQLKSIKTIKISAASETIVNYVDLLRQSSLKLKNLRLKQWALEEDTCALMQLPVKELTEKLQLSPPYIIDEFNKYCSPEKVTCTTLPVNWSGFGAAYDE